jgi:hypothetical protein
MCNEKLRPYMGGWYITGTNSDNQNGNPSWERL